MPEQVSKAQKAFLAAKKDYFKLAEKTDNAITRERNALMRKLNQANAKLRKSRAKLVAAEKRLQKSSTAAAKKQVENISKLIDEGKSEAAQLREALHSVRGRLKASKEYAATAKFFQRGMEKLDKEWNRVFEKKEKQAEKLSAAKKVASKKKAAKKKTTKKKITKKKTTKKKTTKKNAVRKTVTKKKITAKK